MARHPERDIQGHMTRLLRSLRARVYTLGVTRKHGDHYGTMQTPGLPDLLVFLPDSGGTRHLLMIEVKAPGGRLTGSQKCFREDCELAGISYLTGGLDELIAWLVANEYLRDDGRTGVPR